MAPLLLATDNCPLQRAAHSAGPCVHGRLCRASHTRCVVWPTQ